MLCDRRDKLQLRIYLEVFPVFTFFHPALVNHLLGFLNEFDLLDVEDVTYNVPSNVFPFTLMGNTRGNGFPAFCIFPLDTNTGNAFPLRQWETLM